MLIHAAGRSASLQAVLEDRAVEIAFAPAESGKVDLVAMLADLARRGINELHVEAGHKLNGSFVREGRVDEYLIYMAPTLLGVGRELAAFGPLDQLGEVPKLVLNDWTALGKDLRILARAALPT